MTTSRSRRRLIWWAAATQVVAVVAVSCGVPIDDSSFEAIDRADVRGLNDSTSTSTTTTSTTTTSTVPDEPSPPEESTTTVTTEPPAQVESVAIYFLSRGLLQPFSTELDRGYGFVDLVEALEAQPPNGPLGAGLDTLVAQGLIIGVPTTEAGVINIDLDPTVFGEIGTRNQRQAIAQIVFTFLKNTTAIGQVSFTLGGERFRTPTDSGFREIATIDDYPSLLPGGLRPTTTVAEAAVEDDPNATPG